MLDLNVYDQVKKIQPICFENACWAYTVGAAIAIKKGLQKELLMLLQQSVKVFRLSVSRVLLLTTRKVGLGHGNLGKMLLEEETECFCIPGRSRVLRSC